MTRAHAGAAVARSRAPQGRRGAVYLHAGSGKWNSTGARWRRTSPAVARVAHPAAVHGDRQRSRLRRGALCRGGGVNGQAGAMRLAIARALCLADERHRKKLRGRTADAGSAGGSSGRSPGRAGARSRFQFSKAVITHVARSGAGSQRGCIGDDGGGGSNPREECWGAYVAFVAHSTNTLAVHFAERSGFTSSDLQKTLRQYRGRQRAASRRGAEGPKTSCSCAPRSSSRTSSRGFDPPPPSSPMQPRWGPSTGSSDVCDYRY